MVTEGSATIIWSLWVAAFLPAALNAANPPELVAQVASEIPADKIAFAPNSSLVAALYSQSGQIKIWDASAGHQLRTLNPGGRIADFAFSALGDRIIVVDSVSSYVPSGRITVYDTITGRQIRTTRLPPDYSAGATLGPEGRVLGAITFNQKSLNIWDVENDRRGFSVAPYAGGDEKPAAGVPEGIAKASWARLRRRGGAVAFSSDGSLMATWQSPQLVGGSTSTIRIWRTATGGEIQRIAVSEDASAYRFAYERLLEFSPDNQRLVLFTRNEHNIQFQSFVRLVLSSAGREELSRIPRDQQEQIEDRIQVWELPSGKQLLNWNSRRQGPWRETQESSTLISHPMGRSNRALVVATSEDKVRCYDFASLRDCGSWTASPGVRAVAVDASGATVAISESNNTITLHDLGTGRLLRTLSEAGTPVAAIAFEPDGHRFGLSGPGMQVSWDLLTGVARRTGELPAVDGARAIVVGRGSASKHIYSPDGSLLAMGGQSDSLLTFWNGRTGARVSSVALTPGKVLGPASFSPDAKLFAFSETSPPVVSFDPAVLLTINLIGAGNVNNSTKRLPATSPSDASKQIESRGGLASATFLLEDLIAAGDMNNPVIRVLSTPENQRRLVAAHEEFNDLFREIGVSNEVYDTGVTSHVIRVVDVATGHDVENLNCEPSLLRPAAVNFSPDGRLLVTISSGKPTRIESWETTNWKKRPSISKSVGVGIQTAIFSPDGKTLAAEEEYAATFSPNDPVPLRESFRVDLWDSASETERLNIPVAEHVTSMVFTNDGSALAIALYDRTVHLYDSTTGREVNLFRPLSSVRALAFSPDGTLLTAAVGDGTVEIWDVRTGELLATLVLANSGKEWLAIMPNGLFDGSPGAWDQILWRFSENIFDAVPVEMFFSEYYRPGLIAEIARGERPKPQQAIADKDRRQPKIEVSNAAASQSTTEDSVVLSLSVADAPAGARDVRLFRNGQLVRVWHGDVLHGKNSATLTATVRLVDGNNRFVANAFNSDNVKSSDSTQVVRHEGAAKRRGVAYILTVGVDKYANADFNLRYAAADARDFGEQVKLQQERLGHYREVNVTALLDEQANKAAILSALNHLAEVARPEDTIFIYFAGHGVVHDSAFYLIPHDLGYTGRRADLSQSNLDQILGHGISDQEVNRALEGLDASHILLVIDACNSGQALESEEKRPGPMNSAGLAQLAYDKGIYVLTAAQSYQAALESSRLGHGYLTYALVEEGLKSGAADLEPRDGSILAREWLDYAVNRVPELQTENTGKQRLLVRENPAQATQQPRVFYRRELEDDQLIVAEHK